MNSARMASLFFVAAMLLLALAPLAQSMEISVAADELGQGTTSPLATPIDVTLSTSWENGSESHLHVHADVARLAYSGAAQVQLFVEPEGAARVVAGERAVPLSAENESDYAWTLVVDAGAQIAVRALTLKGSVLGGGMFDVNGGLPASRTDGGALLASVTGTAAGIAPGSISLTYSLRYLGQTGSATFPCRYAYCELWRNDGTETRLSTGYADVNGQVSFAGVASGNLKLIFWCKDGSTCSVDDGTTIYSWTGGYQDISSNSDITITADDSLRGVWCAYGSVQDAYYWLLGVTGWHRSAVTVSYPYEDWPHSHGNSIHMSDSGTYTIWDRGVIMHEYGHCIEYVLPGGWPPGGGPNPHYITSESSTGFALMEGWAEFFPSAVMNDSDYFRGMDFESYPFADYQTSGNWDGSVVEGAVASMLWDIYDGVSADDYRAYDLSQYGDRVDRQFLKFWSIFSTARPRSVNDIWSHWSGAGPDLWAIFYYQRINMDTTPPSNPTSAVPDLPEEQWADGMEVTVRLSGATDSVSGIWGYYYAWAGSAADPAGMEFSSEANITAVLQAGNRTLSIRAVDRTGTTAAAYVHFFFGSDEAAPLNPTAISSDHAPSVWTSQSGIEMSWSGASDLGSGVKGYSILFDHQPDTLPDAVMDTTLNTSSAGLSDGIWYFHIRTVDNSSNWADAAVHAGPFCVDTVAPGISAQTLGELGLNDIFITSVTVNISADDPLSGLAAVQFREGSEAFSDYSTPFLVISDGLHQIEVRAIDLAGNVEDHAFSFTIDVTPPPAPTLNSSSIAFSQWSNATAIDLSWLPAQDASGIRGYSVLLTAEAGVMPDALVELAAGQLSALPVQEGTWYVNIRSVDNAGLGSAEALSIGPFLIDRTAPDVTAARASPSAIGWYTNTFRLWLNATDALSGIFLVQTSVNGGPWEASNGSLILGDGLYSLSYRAVDRAGNAGTTEELDVKVDTTFPTAVLAFSTERSAGVWRNRITSFSLSSADAMSGLAAIEYSIDGGEWLNYSAPVAMPEGEHVVRYRARDAAGNVLGPLEVPCFIDLSPPSLSLKAQVGGAVTVNVTAADAPSGLASLILTVDDGEGVPLSREGMSETVLHLAPGKHILNLTAVDAAGNAAVQSAEVVVPPAVDVTLLLVAAALIVIAVVTVMMFRKRKR